MFRRDPLTPVLGEAAELLGLDPATARALGPLARQVFRWGGVLGVSRAGQTRLWALGDVPVGGVFELASVTKPFTAALAAALVARGALTWDTRLSALTGRDRISPLRRLPAQFTPRTLATHTAGLPVHPARTALTTFTQFSDPYGGLSPQAVLSSARRWARRERVPRFGYSNLGVGVLALALAQAAGEGLDAEGYGAALRSLVTGPLDLPGVTLRPHPASLVTPRGLLGGQDPTLFGQLAGAGGLYGTAADLLRFGQAHLRRTSNDSGNAPESFERGELESEPSRLSPQAGTHWQQAQIPPGLPLPRTAVAPGWFYSHAPLGPVVWHDGVARGTRTALGFVPATGAVVTVLARGGVPLTGVRAQVPLLLLHLLGAALPG